VKFLRRLCPPYPRSSCLYASRKVDRVRGGGGEGNKYPRLLGDGVPRPPAEIHVQIAVEYVPEFVPRPVAAATGFIYTAVYDDRVQASRAHARARVSSSFPEIIFFPSAPRRCFDD